MLNRESASSEHFMDIDCDDATMLEKHNSEIFDYVLQEREMVDGANVIVYKELHKALVIERVKMI